MRGLPNFSVLSTCMWIAHNLHLRMKELAEVAKVREISEATFHRRRNQYRGMKANDANELR